MRIQVRRDLRKKGRSSKTLVELFAKNLAAEVAVPEPHHSDLPGHGMLIEFCTSEGSTSGKVGHQHGVRVIRCTEKNLKR